ncbi:MAG: DUF169 domain-containing protein [Planctomycetes bacterium]|nr:DUF169 domain-containing protein [Planctomycetota bacterium]
MSAASQLAELLQLRRQPVAITFQESAPADIPKIDQTAVSGCTYWKQAAEGQTFYTDAADHYGCPIGAHTHGIDLPEEQSRELEGLVSTMVELEYLDPEEVAGIPRREEEFGVALYAPLAGASFEPEVVLVSGNAKQIMLLAEAAHSAGVSCETSMVGRPTCAAIPVVLQSGRSATNLGCIGNRVYTELADDELYLAFAGAQLEPIVQKLAVIVNANSELEKFHRSRLS